MAKSSARQKIKQESGFYEAYAGFARSLRTWFIAYGIGAPVLFLTNKEAWSLISASAQGRTIAYLFLAGVALQIVAAMIYKTAMWYLYVSELENHRASDWRVKVADWISENYWLEIIVFDLGALVLFGWATLKVLQLFA